MSTLSIDFLHPSYKIGHILKCYLIHHPTILISKPLDVYAFHGLSRILTSNLSLVLILVFFWVIVSTRKVTSVLDTFNGKIYISRHVAFVKQIFPFASNSSSTLSADISSTRDIFTLDFSSNQTTSLTPLLSSTSSNGSTSPSEFFSSPISPSSTSSSSHSLSPSSPALYTMTTRSRSGFLSLASPFLSILICVQLLNILL